MSKILFILLQLIIFFFILLTFFYKFLSPSFRRVVIKREMMRRKTYEKFLEGVPILKCLNEDERMNVCDALIPQYFSDGEVIIKQVIMAVTKLVRMYGYPCPGRVRVGGYCSSICEEAVIKTRVLRRWLLITNGSASTKLCVYTLFWLEHHNFTI